jgi:hypothetical protein
MNADKIGFRSTPNHLPIYAAGCYLASHSGLRKTHACECRALDRHRLWRQR